jgi:hypothetical protein
LSNRREREIKNGRGEGWGLTDIVFDPLDSGHIRGAITVAAPGRLIKPSLRHPPDRFPMFFLVRAALYPNPLLLLELWVAINIFLKLNGVFGKGYWILTISTTGFMM